MSDSVRLLEARVILQAAVDAGLKVYRHGLIRVAGMAPGFGDDPNLKHVNKLADYRAEIEHLLPNEGDRADLLPRPALSGLLVTKELPR